MLKRIHKNLAMLLITCLFFLWGFAHNLDPILIPHLKRAFTLTTVQATLIDSSVFIAYFIMAIPAGMLIARLGYKWTIVIGLCVFASGCLLFLPAADHSSYGFFLIALFIIATGLTVLETAANPYIVSIGNPETAPFRLNLAQSFNGLAASLAPILGAKFILVDHPVDTVVKGIPSAAQLAALQAEAQSVKMPYSILAGILFLIALVFVFYPLPEETKKSASSDRGGILRAFKRKSVKWAVSAQFFYVGAQVCIFSLFILYATHSADISSAQAAYYLGGCGLLFTIGRFAGTALMRVVSPPMLLLVYASLCMVLCIPAIFAHGDICIYAVMGICFFMSIMFPTIFSLGLKDLNEESEFASSLLIMAVVGGAILPWCFGYISDESSNIQNGYFVPLSCFGVVLAFAIYEVKRSAIKRISSKAQ